MTPDELAAALIAREEMPPEKGDLGPTGPQGERGQDGRAGADGRPGAVGKAGIDGKTGPRGPKGDKGDKGDPGEAGKDGRDGKDGADAAVPIMRGGVVRGGGIAGITVQNDGTPVGTPNTITTLNFPSGGVTVGTGNSVDIPSGGGGSQTLAQTLALGNDANQLRITNLADGVAATDAATVGQVLPPIVQAGPPTQGQNADWTISGSTGPATLTFRGETTDPFDETATGAELVTLLEALPSVGVGNVRVYGGVQAYADATVADGTDIQWIGDLGAQVTEPPTVDGGNIVVGDNHAGFAPIPSGADAQPLIDTDQPAAYQYGPATDDTTFHAVVWHQVWPIGAPLTLTAPETDALIIEGTDDYYPLQMKLLDDPSREVDFELTTANSGNRMISGSKFTFDIDQALHLASGGTNTNVALSLVMLGAVGDGTVALMVRPAAVEPDDSILAAGDLAIWLDPTNGATALNFKAKSADGTVVTATLPMS